MRRLRTLIATVSIALPFTLPGPSFAEQVSTASQGANPVPRSLDALYPPQARAPVFLLGMLQLDASFSGIVVDLMDGDLAGARENFGEFRRRYGEARQMVPEWSPYYPARPVEELARAFAGGDRGRIMEAFGEVGRTCHHCHLSTMVPTQQTYRWGRFGEVRVTDPLTDEVVDYAPFKRQLSANLAGIGVNLRQGQVASALRQFEGFRARFAELKRTCRSCHDRDSKYYVDEEIQVRVEALGEALAKGGAPPATLDSLLQGIGQDSCSRCHLVHVPAAIAQATLR